MTRLMRPGETYVVPKINGLTFNTGNAGALSLSQGDMVVPKLGKIGEIIDKRLKELNSTKYQDETGDDKIYHVSNPKGSFVIIGDSNKGKEILRNNVTLTEEQKDTEYEKIYVDNKVIDESKENYIEWSSRNLYLTTNQSYKVFNNATTNRLLSKLDKGKIGISF